MRYQDRQLIISSLSSLVIILGLGITIVGLSSLRSAPSTVLGTQTQSSPTITISPTPTNN